MHPFNFHVIRTDSSRKPEHLLLHKTPSSCWHDHDDDDEYACLLMHIL